jgi:hypothetical protein
MEVELPVTKSVNKIGTWTVVEPPSKCSSQPRPLILKTPNKPGMVDVIVCVTFVSLRGSKKVVVDREVVAGSELTLADNDVRTF